MDKQLKLSNPSLCWDIGWAIKENIKCLSFKKEKINKTDMKTRIVKGRNSGTYEVEYKLYWVSPWQPVYIDNGLPFPFRGTYKEAQKVEQALIRKLG